ncbi:MAG: hypothetical protein ACJ780_29840 [Solirubrobacteraceae bacterium]
MSRQEAVSEPELERKSTVFALSGVRFLVLGALLAVPGIVLIVLGTGWVFALGLALLALGLVPAIVALGLLLSGLVARWAARRRPFA